MADKGSKEHWMNRADAWDKKLLGRENKTISEIELRSEKVRNLLGEIPPSLVRWGTVIIVAIFLILLLVVCFMPYPHSQGESIFQHLFMM